MWGLDSGSDEIRKAIERKRNEDNISSTHHNYCENLYVMFVPDKADGAIEDLFDKEILETKVDGKTFSCASRPDNRTQYGKIVFAEKVIRAKQSEINFDGFKQVFDKIKLIINEYGKKQASGKE